jgi:hypothetical protein
VPFGLATPIRAQVPNSNEQSTSLNDWVQDARDDATQNAIQFSLDHLTVAPSYIAWGSTINTDNLQTATWQRDYSASSAWFYANQLSDTEAAIESARAKAIDLQSQLTQARATIGAPQSVSARIGEIESNLKQANSTLSQATADKSYLEFRLATAESDLQQARADMGSAQRGLFYYSELAPRMNAATSFAAEHWPLVGIGSNVSDLLSNPTYRVQSAEGSFRLTGVLLDSASYAGGEAFWAESLGPVGAFRNTLHDADLTYNAFQHDNEARNLAFGGELSSARLPEIHFAPPDFDSFSGSFHTLNTDNRLSIAGSWTAVYGNITDHFNAESAYSFNQLQTASGHILTGTGIVSFQRVEQHDPFQHEPLLNWINVFNFNDPMTMTETTRRNESYNDSFNGALANQQIQRAESNFRPGVPNIPATPPDVQLYQDILKRPPYIFIPPPSPPRPEQNAFSNDNRESNSPPQVKGVLMPATVVNSKPTDKADTSQVFGTDDGK